MKDPGAAVANLSLGYHFDWFEARGAQKKLKYAFRCLIEG